MGKIMTANVLPDGDVVKEWGSTGINHCDQIDEISPLTSDYIFTTYWDGTAHDRFTMQNAGQKSSVFTKIIVKIYCEETTPGLKIHVTPYINGSPLSGKYINCPSTPGWVTDTWDNLEYDKNAMNTLEIQVRANIADKMGVIFIYSLYAEFTYSTPWAPDEWTDPIVTKNGNYAYTSQSFKWNTDSMEILWEKAWYYQYEVRRSIDVWDFMQPGFLCLYCFVEYSTNLPSIVETWQSLIEESDIWLKLCCGLFSGSDEEAELKSPALHLFPDRWYIVELIFKRRQQNQSFTLWTESEWCGGLPLTGCHLGFEWVLMTTSSEVS